MAKAWRSACGETRGGVEAGGAGEVLDEEEEALAGQVAAARRGPGRGRASAAARAAGRPGRVELGEPGGEGLAGRRRERRPCARGRPCRGRGSSAGRRARRRRAARPARSRGGRWRRGAASGRCRAGARPRCGRAVPAASSRRSTSASLRVAGQGALALRALDRARRVVGAPALEEGEAVELADGREAAGAGRLGHAARVLVDEVGLDVARGRRWRSRARGGRGSRRSR